MDDKIERLARVLAEAWTAGRTVPLPPIDDAPVSRAEAYAVQDRMAELIGGRVAGWKVGATVKAVQLFEGHDGPLPGRIFADRLYESPAEVSAALVTGLKIEAEFAFRLTHDLGPDEAPFNAAAIAGSVVLHPALELAGSRYAPGTGYRAARTFDGIADNGSSGAAVIGPAIENWQGLELATMGIELTIDGSPPVQAYSGAYRRDPVEITAETLNDLAARGVGLKRGDFILTGSLTLPTPLKAGQAVSARFGDHATLKLRMT